jgi:hypothetical protein
VTATAKAGAELDRLFAAPLTTFVEERKRLAAELKASGRPKEAIELGKTPKPSASAWVVNQLARQEAPLLKSLADTTARLQGAQRPGAKAARADHTTQALAAHREALKLLRTRAEEILTASGQAARPQILEKVVRNLRVGMASQEIRPRIESGRLVQDLAEEDFVSLLGGPSGPADDDAESHGAVAASMVAANPAPADEPPFAESGKARELARRQAAAQAAEEAKTRARAEAERARAKAEAERRIRTLKIEAETARRTHQKEERAVEAARQTLAEAEDRLQRARLESERIARALREAETSRGRADPNMLPA